jgi:hypothetical protein
MMDIGHSSCLIVLLAVLAAMLAFFRRFARFMISDFNSLAKAAKRIG